jgi:hypothetical protein
MSKGKGPEKGRDHGKYRSGWDFIFYKKYIDLKYDKSKVRIKEERYAKTRKNSK